MTEYGEGYWPGAGQSAAAQPSTGDVAKQQASEVGQSVRGAGSQVAGTATERAKDVVAEAQWQARDLLAQAQGQARDQARAQQQQAAGRLHGLAEELSAMAANSGQDGTAAEFARQASGRLHGAASWLEQREPGELVEEVRRFARRRPAVFLFAAAAAGIVAGRLTRGAVEAQKDSQAEAPAAGDEGWAAQTATAPVIPAPADMTVGPPPPVDYGMVQP